MVARLSLPSAALYALLIRYDVLVRHAFGNYRALLAEVAFSPAMADYLTFRNNRAFAAAGTVPDENFAREVMQLFTVGLWELSMDGRRQVMASSLPHSPPACFTPDYPQEYSRGVFWSLLSLC